MTKVLLNRSERRFQVCKWSEIHWIFLRLFPSDEKLLTLSITEPEAQFQLLKVIRNFLSNALNSLVSKL